VLSAVSKDGQLIMGSVTARIMTGETAMSSEVYSFNPADGSVNWSDMMPFSSHQPENTESISHLAVSADGSRIAVVAAGYRTDPVFEPYHIYIYDSAGQELHTFEIEDSENRVAFPNDIRLTD